MRLSDAELTSLDELRPGGTPPGHLSCAPLLQEPPSGNEVATRTESLAIPTRLARDGRVTAAIALAREPRDDQLEPAGELARLLRDEWNHVLHTA